MVVEGNDVVYKASKHVILASHHWFMPHRSLPYRGQTVQHLVASTDSLTPCGNDPITPSANVSGQIHSGNSTTTKTTSTKSLCSSVHHADLALDLDVIALCTSPVPDSPFSLRHLLPSCNIVFCGKHSGPNTTSLVLNLQPLTSQIDLRTNPIPRGKPRFC